MIAESKVLNDDRTVVKNTFKTAGFLRGKALRPAIPYLCVFFLAFFTSIAHNFLEPNTKTVYFADSRNYLRSSNYICTAILGSLNGKDMSPFLAQDHVAARIENDGPILSTILACIFAVIGHPPESNDWKILVVIQCFIHAATAALVVALTRQIVASMRWATAAGVAFALYPGGIIASGRVMTETLSCLLCVAYILLLLASTRSFRWSPLCGIVAGLSWTMKVVLIPPVIAALLFFSSARKLKIASLAVIIAGIFLIVSPWAHFSKQFLHRTMITTERASVHNAYIGWDTETDGFQASFPTPKEAMMLSCDPVSVIWGQVLSDPVGCTLLTLEKFARYYGLPFNDFRHSCYGLSNLQLIPVHLFYLFAGLLGIVCAAGMLGRLPAERKLACQLSLVVLFFMQCYFLFEANTRYGYTAMPLLVSFGALGAALCVELYREKKLVPLVSCLAASCLLTFLVANSEAIVKHNHPQETCHKLVAGDSISANIKLNLPKYNGPVYAIVLVDGDESLAAAQLTVNGKAVSEPLMPLPIFDSRRFSQFNLMKEYGYGLKASVQDLRKWRAAIVPTEWLNLTGDNTIDIKAKTNTLIYGDAVAGYRKYRSLDDVAVNRLLYTPEGLEARPIEPVSSGLVQKKFVFSRNRTGNKVLTDESLRIHLALLKPVNQSRILPSLSDEKSAERRFKQDDFPLLMRVHGSDQVTSSKFIVAHSITSLATPIPQYKRATHVRITLTGDLRSAKKDAQAGIVVSAGGDKDLFWLLPQLPYSIPASPDWKDFSISDLLPLNAFAGGAKQVGIGIYPGPWPEVMGLGPTVAGDQIFLKNLKIKFEPVASIDLNGASLMLY